MSLNGRSASQNITRAADSIELARKAVINAQVDCNDVNVTVIQLTIALDHIAQVDAGARENVVRMVRGLLNKIAPPVEGPRNSKMK